MPALKQHNRKDPKRKPNPYAQRGLDEFALLSAELQEARKTVSTKLGTPLSLVRFASSSDPSKWVPIIIPQTSPQAEMHALSTVSHVLDMHADGKIVRSSFLQRSFQDKNVITADHLTSASTASKLSSFRDARTSMTEMPSPSLLVVTPTTRGKADKFSASAPSTPRSFYGAHRDSLSQDTSLWSEHPPDIEVNKPLRKTLAHTVLGSSTSGSSRETLHDKGRWHINAEKLGQALTLTGLVFVLIGLMLGYFPALFGLVCWWYLLPSMRQAVGDKPVVRSHHHHHHHQISCEDGNKINTHTKAGKVTHVARVHSSGRHDIISSEYKKKVILDGLVERRRHKGHV